MAEEKRWKAHVHNRKLENFQVQNLADKFWNEEKMMKALFFTFREQSFDYYYIPWK